ncbi:uncharacterized protein LOC121401237 [Xenopus laevis]|uniref:Uncharacterized protein LOC121401237 n=1 Tax=Xenopus laevis TaxID=8355 RepID=A0A8J1MJD8_XENLA|nr:uncharacterized protein LOC121401237 [Xenopus laevis]
MDLSYFLLAFYLFILSFIFKMNQFRFIYWILFCSLLIPHVCYGSAMDQRQKPRHNSKPIRQTDAQTDEILFFMAADIFLWIFLICFYLRRELSFCVFLWLIIVKIGDIIVPSWGLVSNMFHDVYRIFFSSKVNPTEAELEAVQRVSRVLILCLSNAMVIFVSIVGLRLWSKVTIRQLINTGRTVMQFISATVSDLYDIYTVKEAANKEAKPAKTKKTGKKKCKKVTFNLVPQLIVDLEPENSAQDIEEPIKSVQEIVEPGDSSEKTVASLYPTIIDIRQKIILVDGLSQGNSVAGHTEIPCMRSGSDYNTDMNNSVLPSVPTVSQAAADVPMSVKKKNNSFSRFIQSLRDRATRSNKKKSGKSMKNKIIVNVTSCFRCHSVESDT